MRTKTIISLVLTAVLSLIIGACGLRTVIASLETLSVDTENVRTEYFIGEEFSPEGLVVTAEVKRVNASQVEKFVLDESQYQLDASAFDNTKAGVYPIQVSYTLDNGTRDGETKTVSFDVSVIESKYDGLAVALKDGVESVCNLTGGSLLLDASQITVNAVDHEGNVTDEEVTDYTLSLYKGKTEVQLVEGVATITEGGVYQIWVEKPSDRTPSYMLKAFISVYVVDNPVALEWDSQYEGTLTTQEEGSDIITETWKFVVVYESGAEKTVSVDEVDFVAEPDTKTAGEYTVAATYSEENILGEVVTTSQAEVAYTITEKVVSGGTFTSSVNISDIDISGVTSFEYTENTQLAEGITVLATASKKVTVDGNNKTLNGVEYTQRLKLNGAGSQTERAIMIEAQGSGTFTLYAITGSSSDLTRTLGLYDAANIQITETEGLPNALTEVVFEIPAAGTYYVYGAKAINIYYMQLTVQLPAPTETTVSVNISDIDISGVTSLDYTENTQLAEGITVLATASKKVTVDGNTKTLNGVEYTQRLKLNGAGSQTERAIMIEAQGSGTFTLYAITGSGSDLTRTLGLYDAANTQITQTEGLPNALTEVVFEIPAAGTYYVYGAKAINIYYMQLTTTVESATTVTDEYAFSLDQLIAEMTAQLGAEPADKTALKATYFTGSNAFLTLGGSLGSSDQYRKSSACIELKTGYLSVTFQGTGTLTFTFASTGGSNTSYAGVRYNGAIIAPQTVSGTATTIAEGELTNALSVQGTTYVTVVYEITEPGTYQICSFQDATITRGTRFRTINVVDNHRG